MIGAFARKFGSKDAATEVEVEDGGLRYRGGDGHVREDKDLDAIPEPFAEKLSYDGGDVVVVPLLEALRAAWRGRRRAP